MSATLEQGVTWTNWGGSVSCTPAHVAKPLTVAEVQHVVVSARERGLTVKPIGAGHSFSAIGATDGIRIDLSNLSGIVAVEGNLVTLWGGTFLHQLPELLRPHNLALANMGDIDRQTISGATSTGTHGTGGTFGGIATQIRAVTLVTADGELLTVDQTQNAHLLPAVALGLGALGVVVEVTIECVPSFLLRAVERPENIDAVLDTFRVRVEEVDHFEFYWFPHTDIALTKTNTRIPAPAEPQPLGRVRRWIDDELMSNTLYAGVVNTGRALPRFVPPINRLAARLTGNRDYTDHSYAVFTAPRRVRFVEMEYALPIDEVPAALREVRALINGRGWNISFPIEVRAAAPDDLMLSTASGRPTGYIAVHRYYRENHEEYFRGVESVMKRHDGRPHWGKMHYRDAESLRGAYPRFDEFAAVRDQLDPTRLFANDYLTRVLGA